MNHKKVIKICIAVLLIIAVIACILIVPSCKQEVGRRVQTNSDIFNYKWKDLYSPEGMQEIVSPMGFALNGAKITTKDKSNGYKSDVATLEPGNTISFDVNVKKAGSYQFKYDYYDLTDGLNKSDFSLKVNDKYQYEELKRVPISVFWKNSQENFEKDRFGNEIEATQDKYNKWTTSYAVDFQKLYATPLMIDLKAGNNHFELKLNLGKTLIGDVAIVSRDKEITYEEYLKKHDNATPSAEPIVLEAEKPSYKNSVSILASSDPDLNAHPYDTYSQLINSIQGDTFYAAGDAITYSLDVKESGMYKVMFRYKQSEVNEFAVFRKVLVNGVCPYKELEHYSFPYATEYQNAVLGSGNTDYLVYLEKGKNELSLAVDISPYSEIILGCKKTMSEINQLYLELKRLVGNVPDKNRDWKIEEYFPNIVKDLNGYINRLEGYRKEIKKINASEVQTYCDASLQSAISSMQTLLEKPDEIPNNISKFTESSGSIVQSISEASSWLQYQPMVLDQVSVFPKDKSYSPENHGVAASTWDGTKRLWDSFFTDKYKDKSDENTITVWLNRPNFVVSQVQKMTDTVFTKKTGIKVVYSRMPDEGKITLSSMAKTTPDVAMGVSNWMPFDLGLRTVAYDMMKFEDFPEVASRFSPGALVPLIVDGKAFAIPETQNFQVLYYRKDIIENLNIPIPDTWDDLIKVLPELQRHGMNFYIPTSDVSGNKGLATTAPFIYQNGGSLYNEEGTASAIDSESSIKGMKQLTDLYNVYGLPLQVANFYEKFRDGSIPMGVAGLDAYIMLKIAAPELNGLWDIAVSPGVKNNEGVVERWQSGSGTSNMIFSNSKHPEKAWELLKWWMSDETQTNFGITLSSLFGDEFLWNSANVNAFKNATMDPDQREVVLKQWEWLIEYPRIPGWYMVERELSNAWNSVVFDAKNPRAQIDLAAESSNKEIRRKLNEFGYMDGQKVIKNYDVTTIEDIQKIINNK